MRKSLILPLLLVAAPAAAQSGLDGRVGRLESEMRAVQRKVFPQGAGTFLEPQITAPEAQRTPAGTPATAPLADLDARVVTLEQQIATMTGQIEQSQYRLRQLEDQFAAYKRATDAKLAAAPPASTGDDRDDEPARPASSVRPPTATTRPPAAPAVSKDPARVARVAAIAKPAADNAEEAYLYGYRMWDAKLYPEAIAQLETVVTKYPKHRRASYAQNLIGRAHLDNRQPSAAALAFYKNYERMREGERAPDSLFFLGQALRDLKRDKDACRAYDQLVDEYPSAVSDARRAEITRFRASAKCP